MCCLFLALRCDGCDGGANLYRESWLPFEYDRAMGHTLASLRPHQSVSLVLRNPVHYITAVMNDSRWSFFERGCPLDRFSEADVLLAFHAVQTVRRSGVFNMATEAFTAAEVACEYAVALTTRAPSLSNLRSRNSELAPLFMREMAALFVTEHDALSSHPQRVFQTADEYVLGCTHPGHREYAQNVASLSLVRPKLWTKGLTGPREYQEDAREIFPYVMMFKRVHTLADAIHLLEDEDEVSESDYYERVARIFYSTKDDETGRSCNGCESLLRHRPSSVFPARADDDKEARCSEERARFFETPAFLIAAPDGFDDAEHKR